MKHSVHPCPKTPIVQHLNPALLRSGTNSGLTNTCIPLCWLCKEAATSGKRGFSNILNQHTCFLSKWPSEIVFPNVAITMTIFKKSLGTKLVTSIVSKLGYINLKEKMSCFSIGKEGMLRHLSSQGLLLFVLSEYTGGEHSHAVDEQQFLHYILLSAQRKGALTINSSQFLLPHIALCIQIINCSTYRYKAPSFF